MKIHELHNAGTTVVQKQYRVNIYQACKAFNIKEGDRVEVWIKPAKMEEGI